MRVMLLSIALALASLAGIAPADAETARPLRVRDLNIDGRRPRAPEAGAGIIVLSARGLEAGRTGGVTTFTRLEEATAAPEPTEQANAQQANAETPPATAAIMAEVAAQAKLMKLSSRDALTIFSNSGRGQNDARLREYRAFQAPPGRYVLSNHMAMYTGTSHPGRQYCFGTIGFDLAAGDVLYVGDYVGIGRDDPALDYDLDDAKRALAVAPQLQAAVKPAQLLEGVEFRCNWAAMARYQVSERERSLLVAAHAMPPPPAPAVVAEAESAETPLTADAAPQAQP